MPDDRFEDRLRAIARQLSQSLAETDLDDVAERLGVDPERVRGAAGAVEGWLGGRGEEPLFADRPATTTDPRSDIPAPAPTGGPHPLDLPGDAQGRALSGLASGRWTVRPGSGRLAPADGDGAATPPAPPSDPDLVGELRARDWITADGTVTLVGRQALGRWCATAASPGAAGTTGAVGTAGAPDSAARRTGAPGSGVPADDEA